MPYCPIGFHTGPGGNPTGIGDYFQQLDAAGRPAILKSVDAYGFCRELATLRQKSGVPHVIVFRMAGGDLELPDYNLPPEQAAQEHWQRIRTALPPEMEANGDQDHVWLEVINEPDKNRADWLGRFMFHTGQKALTDGFKLCGPGWSTGEPEPVHWTEPGWLDYLRLCEENPGRIAIALHEYSLSNENIFNMNGALIGRFRQLFDICDAHGIARPEVLITEWGWNATTVPGPAKALGDIHLVSNLYKRYPEISGATTWYLGPGFDGIAHQTQRLIAPLTTYALSNEWGTNSRGLPQDPCRGTPRVQYARVYQLIHNDVSEDEAADIFRSGLTQRRTTGWSADDAGIGDLDNRQIDIFSWPAGEHPVLIAWYQQYYPGVGITFKSIPEQTVRIPAESAPSGFLDGDCRGSPRVQYNRVYQLIHPTVDDETAEVIFRQGFTQRRTTGWSFDDAGIGDLDNRTVEIFGAPENEKPVINDWYTLHYPAVNVVYREIPQPPHDDFWLENPLAREIFITSYFNEPRDYDGDGVFDDLHEGIDFAGLLNGQPVVVKAAQDGAVIEVINQADGFGKHIKIRHVWPDGHTYVTWYAHLSRIDVQVGQSVTIGQPIGITGDTGNADGVHLHLSLQHLGHGLPGYVIPDVVDPLPYFGDIPPPTGEALLGLHATGDPLLALGELNAFITARIELVKCLSNLDPAAVLALASALPESPWVVRAFLSMAGRDISPAQFVNDTISDMERTLNLLPGREIWVELHNEPNLNAEGMGTSWANGTEFQSWFLDVLNLYRAEYPNMKFLYPGLSPGGTIPGIRQDHMQFLLQSKEAVRQADGFGAHVYWAYDFPMNTALGMLDGMLDFLRDNGMSAKPVFVTEASNNKGNTAPAQKGAEYITFWEELLTRPVTRGVTYFIASARDPAFQEEVWVSGGASRGIAEVVGAR